jgi:hypothetical protein
MFVSFRRKLQRTAKDLLTAFAEEERCSILHGQRCFFPGLAPPLTIVIGLKKKKQARPVSPRIDGSR